MLSHYFSIPHSFALLPHSVVSHITYNDDITNILNQAMHLVWNLTLADLQIELIPRLLMIWCVPYHPQALLIVQCTGSGKSDIAQTVGSCDFGVMLSIVDILALATDQRSKIVSTNGVYDHIYAQQLDSIKRNDPIDKLKPKLKRLETIIDCHFC